MSDEEFRGLCNTYGFAPSRSLRELLETATAQAAISEREACAVAAEKQARWIGYNAHAEAIAAAIRARGQA